jgi:tetratricopeptide (TPR) repeat protein
MVAVTACFTPVASVAADSQVDEKKWKASYEAGIKAIGERSYAAADKQFAEALAVAASFKPGDSRLRQALEQLVKVKFLRADFTNAAPLSEQLVAQTEVAFGTKSEHLFKPLYLHGRISARINRFETAHQFLKRGEEIGAWKWGSYSSQVGYCRVARAETYFREAKYAEAEPLFAEGLKLMGEERSQKKFKPTTGSTKPVQVVREVFRPDFSDVAEFSRQQAWTKFKLGKIAEAEECYKDLLSLVQARLDEDARIIPNVQRNFAEFYIDQKRWDEADRLLLKAIPAAEAAYGANSVVLLNYLRSAGRVQEALDRPAEAEATRQRIKDIQAKAAKKQ